MTNRAPVDKGPDSVHLERGIDPNEKRDGDDGVLLMFVVRSQFLP
jgi:hypothetical protein